MLNTDVADLAPGDQTFSFLVPGNRVWHLLSVYAVCDRAAGGAPDRAFLLTVSYQVATVAQVGAADAGGEPGQCSVTWADTASSSVGSGGVGIAVAPVPKLKLPPGYIITGSIVNPAAGDRWTSAVCWYDYTETG